MQQDKKREQILIVDLVDPSGTRYLHKHLVANFMWGKSLKEYKLFMVKDFEMIPIDVGDCYEVAQLQKKIEQQMTD